MRAFDDVQNARLRERMNEWMAINKKKQNHLAERLGVKGASLHRFLNGGGASYMTAQRFADLVNVKEVSELVGPPCPVDRQREPVVVKDQRSYRLQLARDGAVADGTSREFADAWVPDYQTNESPTVRQMIDDMMADERAWQRRQTNPEPAPPKDRKALVRKMEEDVAKGVRVVLDRVKAKTPPLHPRKEPSPPESRPQVRRKPRSETPPK